MLKAPAAGVLNFGIAPGTMVLTALQALYNLRLLLEPA